jgi:hypothetical protein
MRFFSFWRAFFCQTGVFTWSIEHLAKDIGRFQRGKRRNVNAVILNYKLKHARALKAGETYFRCRGILELKQHGQVTGFFGGYSVGRCRGLRLVYTVVHIEESAWGKIFRIGLQPEQRRKVQQKHYMEVGTWRISTVEATA